MTRPQPGDRINNYLLDELIGTGTFGEVWKAHHHIFNDPVAIKIPTGPQYVRHLQEEGMAVRRLTDPHIVRVHDLDPYADPPYLVMEYIDGPSLRDVLDEHRDGLTIGQAVAVLYGLLSALEAAHAADVIHRDIKPANILISNGHNLGDLVPGRVRVTDFGLLHRPDAQTGSMRQSGSVDAADGGRLVGAVAYMSPEQRDGQELDARSDLYAVGVVLHEMLTGRLPFGGDPPGALRPEVPAWLDQLFDRTHSGRDRRYGSAEEIKGVIEHEWSAARGWAVNLPPERRPPRMKREGDRWRCAQCGGFVGEGDLYCNHCGWQLADHVPRCPTCHATVARTDNFCIHCGTDLRVRV